MSRYGHLDLAGLRAVDAAMSAERAIRACKQFTQYAIDERGIVTSEHADSYAPVEVQETTLGTRYYGCTCPDQGNAIEKLNRLMQTKAREELREARAAANMTADSAGTAQDAISYGARCRCKHEFMRNLACGLPVFIHLGSVRYRVTLAASGKPFYRKSFAGRHKSFAG